MASFSIEFDTDSIEDAFDKLEEIIEKKLKKSYGQALADQLLSNILQLINEGQWESATGSPVYGIVDSGEYKGSWESIFKGDSIEVGSFDPKAPKIEDGTEPEDHAELQDGTVIAWARRAGLPNPAQTGKKIADNIRLLGLPPKPVLRQAINKLRSQNQAIKKEVVRQFGNL